MKYFNSSLKALLLLLSINVNMVQAEQKIYTGYFNNKAASGFDVVSYFNAQKPVKGLSTFTFEYKNADWYFSSQKNLDLFKKNPSYFSPQYGGYCAWAMASNKTAPGNVPFWTLYRDKLYLNYDQKTQDTWQADKDTFIIKADINWQKRNN